MELELWTLIPAFCIGSFFLYWTMYPEINVWWALGLNMFAAVVIGVIYLFPERRLFYGGEKRLIV